MCRVTHEDFNSIKVQLKRSVLHPRGVVFLQFQFHKGTIKTYKWTKKAHRRAKFQFHKGTIKTAKPLILNLQLCNFNSIKVQLKQVTFSRFLQFEPNFNSIKVQLKRKMAPTFKPKRKFQFHKGTIKTWLKTFSAWFVRYFNSIKVQLKQVFHLAGVQGFTASISIP